jgi:hypothetical protein
VELEGKTSAIRAGTRGVIGKEKNLKRKETEIPK